MPAETPHKFRSQVELLEAERAQSARLRAQGAEIRAAHEAYVISVREYGKRMQDALLKARASRKTLHERLVQAIAVAEAWRRHAEAIRLAAGRQLREQLATRLTEEKEIRRQRLAEAYEKLSSESELKLKLQQELQDARLSLSEETEMRRRVEAELRENRVKLNAPQYRLELERERVARERAEAELESLKRDFPLQELLQVKQREIRSLEEQISRFSGDHGGRGGPEAIDALARYRSTLAALREQKGKLEVLLSPPKIAQAPAPPAAPSPATERAPAQPPVFKRPSNLFKNS